MKTEDLIEALALDAGPTSSPGSRLMLAPGLGALIVLPLMILWIGLRPDLGAAMISSMFWTKALYTAVLATAGYWCVERLSRPIGSARRGVVLAACVFGLLALSGAWQFMTVAPVDQMPTLLGKSWTRCPRNIVILSLPILAFGFWVVRGLAPTRLVAAGAAIGLFAGGIAATIYGLHCPESTMTFLAVWYSLGVAVVVGLGALLGPWALRWR